MPNPLHLLPRPRELRPRSDLLRLASVPEIRVRAERPAEAERAKTRLLAALGRDAGLRAAKPASGAPAVELEIEPSLDLPAEGFELAIEPRGVRLVARDRRGLNWGAGLLVQLVRQRGGELPGLVARDWPDFPVRGYMLDVSRDRVPTMATLALVLDLLEELRLNELQLYTEHTFAYAAHERVWRAASPLTPGEIRSLDAACAERGIELVPNQNSFGHMERWLAHDEYGHLAELDGPAQTSRGARARACLAPTPESVAFVRSLHRELVPNFASRTLNIGCDETFELGRGRSRAACEARGKGRVYLDYLLELLRGLHAEDRSVQFWGDIVEQHPELIGELPRERTVALAWGYDAPRDPARVAQPVRELLASVGITDLERLRGFDRLAGPYANAGVPFRVCPGTSAWLSLTGRLRNALANLDDAVDFGRRGGAEGVLITDWGDLGHLQPPVVSLPPLAYGAAVAWCKASQSELELAGALDALILRDDAGVTGRALVRLGELSGESGYDALNSSPLAMSLFTPFGRVPFLAWGEATRARLDALAAEIAGEIASLSRARPRGFGGAICARELAQTAALLRHGTLRLMHSATGSGPAKDELARDLAPLVAEQAACWRERSREGGLADSVARLEHALGEY